MNLHTHEELLDYVYGVKGTPRRDEFEAQMEDIVLGDAIRHTRESKNITKEQLGDMIGVTKSQVSRIENGGNVTLATIRKIFCALNTKANIEVAGVGRFSL